MDRSELIRQYLNLELVEDPVGYEVLESTDDRFTYIIDFINVFGVD